MELKNKMEAILKERKGLNINDDYGIEKCWNEMTILLTQNEDETIDYLNNAMRRIYTISVKFLKIYLNNFKVKDLLLV
ncbi:hypothetical protein [Enterococcus faecalis]|uniref:hypothetical protein n=1 Tax=Enterococcus faecalis TaxID=1351 RepID=UPI00215C9524|nr:hypothetical protein [Enterococcus faecalis]